MLRVGLLPGPSAAAVRARLLALGAVPAGRDHPSSDDDPAIAIVELDSADDVRLVHLALDAWRVEAGEPDDHGGSADVVLAGRDGEAELAAMVDELWRERLVPFEANLRTGARAPRRRRPVLVEPDPAWGPCADRLIGRLHEAIGGTALRIDHIGSTSVAGLRAKDLVDIQVTVADLERAADAVAAARRAGFVPVAGDWSARDRHGLVHPELVAVDADPGRPTNVNIRPSTAPVWRESILFRDWLRAHPDERGAYEAMKRELAAGDDAHVDVYGDAKAPWIHDGLARAERWAARTGWSP